MKPKLRPGGATDGVGDGWTRWRGARASPRLGCGWGGGDGWTRERGARSESGFAAIAYLIEARKRIGHFARLHHQDYNQARE